ncbi:trypsin-like serine protease [Pseudobacteriovorax antillogorgiicola]|uniref:trypsin-like serine protease n=1 Tax=Pseudobacteriovorax antillogorgiicola TaxID=1513793 RepID=UPI0013564BC9
MRNKEFKSSANPSKGICFGDSGGPSFIKNSDGLRVVGVNSGIDFSIESEGCGPGLNINAKSQESWINQAIEDLENGN